MPDNLIARINAQPLEPARPSLKTYIQGRKDYEAALIAEHRKLLEERVKDTIKHINARLANTTFQCFRRVDDSLIVHSAGRPGLEMAMREYQALYMAKEMSDMMDG